MRVGLIPSILACVSACVGAAHTHVGENVVEMIRKAACGEEVGTHDAAGMNRVMSLSVFFHTPYMHAYVARHGVFSCGGQAHWMATCVPRGCAHVVCV